MLASLLMLFLLLKNLQVCKGSQAQNNNNEEEQPSAKDTAQGNSDKEMIHDTEQVNEQVTEQVNDDAHTDGDTSGENVNV